MPGPRNAKKGKKVRVKKCKKSTSVTVIQAPAPPKPSPPVHKLEPPSSDIDFPSYTPPHIRPTPYVQDLHDDFIPSIHDPGNGPRVRDVRAFLSSFFAQPPSLDDPLCAEFSQEEVLQMLCTTLPDETATVSTTPEASRAHKVTLPRSYGTTRVVLLVVSAHHVDVFTASVIFCQT
jgi:hypothetical protein